MKANSLAFALFRHPKDHIVKLNLKGKLANNPIILEIQPNVHKILSLKHPPKIKKRSWLG